MRSRADAIFSRVGYGSVVGAEIGVYLANFSRRLLQTNRNLFLYMIDRWCPPPKDDSYYNSGSSPSGFTQEEFDNVYNCACKKVDRYYERLEIIKKSSIEASKKIKDNSLDFVFIDGDHSYEGVKADIEAWKSKVKPGGWICGHDYDGKEEHGGVNEAVDELFGNRVEKDVGLTWFVKTGQPNTNG